MDNSSTTENNSSGVFIPKIVNTEPNINVDLHKAATAGNLDDVIRLINSGAKINHKYSIYFTTPLIEASINGHDTVVDYLISKEADLNSVDNENNSALIFACKERYLPIVKSLIKAGADKDIQNTYGETGLIIAAAGGYESIVNELINAGANLNIKDKRGLTAIVRASDNEHQTIADSLNREKLRRQAPIEKAFRDKLISLDPTIEAAISKGTDIDIQITRNINIDDDYEEIIKRFIGVNIEDEDKVLLVDFENIVHHTRNKNIFKKNKSKGDGIKLIPSSENKGVLFPNVGEKEIDYFRIATFFILNYAVTNGFTCVVVVCKEPTNFGYFNDDYKSIVNKGRINFPKSVEFEQTFNCQEIQKAIKDGQLKCITCDVKTACFTGQCIDKPCAHKLKGCDDSIIAIMYSLLKKHLIKTENLELMSRDFKTFVDFIYDQEYYVPFDLELKNLRSENTSLNLVVNFVLRRFNLPPGVTDESINRVIAKEENFVNLTKLVSKYYYNQSTLNESKTGYDVRNWYSINTDTDGSLKTEMNTPLNTPPTKNFVSQPYVTIDSNGELIPHLNPSGLPYLDQSGNIARLNSNPTIPYVEYDNESKTYKAASILVRLEPYKFNGYTATIQVGINPNGKPIYKSYCYYDTQTGTYLPNLENGEPYKNTYGMLNIIISNRKYEPYCKKINGIWVANLKKIVQPYTLADGSPDTINVYEWQPYLNKYKVVEHSSYFQKYMKYKAKYNALKTKLSL